MIDFNPSRNLTARRRSVCFTALFLLTGLRATSLPAQSFTNLHNFTATSGTLSTNRDGANPEAGLTVSGNTFYGTAYYGGGWGNGTAFALHSDGTGFTNVLTFTALAGSPFPITNSDGANPFAGLISSGNTLYGTANSAGTYGSGTVFSLNTDDMGFTNLYSFTGGSDGAGPDAGLVLSDNTLYGTTVSGGTNNNGTVFAVNADGLGFTNLHTFTTPSGPFPATNSEGANPYAGLISSGNTLYGTANFGGTNGSGTVFALNTDGTGFTNLHTFTRGGYNAQNYFTNSDGANPNGTLILSGNTLYGTAETGGSSGTGTIFAVNTDGTGFTNLHTFTTATQGGSPNYFSFNSDGAAPGAGLILSGNTLYGTTSSGNAHGTGTVFAITTNGTGFTTLYDFTAVSGSAGHNLKGINNDGARPNGLILSGNTLYGTASAGGSSGNGTVFGLSFPPPQLTSILSGTNLVLTWPASVAGFSYAGYVLQSTTNLVAPVVWATNSPAPVLANGQLTVTNPITGTQQFYRLSQ
jgi:uncharacterized repeat protein (TIGR03803 family)